MHTIFTLVIKVEFEVLDARSPELSLIAAFNIKAFDSCAIYGSRTLFLILSTVTVYKYWCRSPVCYISSSAV